MRYWIGFVIAVAFVAAPVAVQGQHDAYPSSEDSWLRLQLSEPESLRVPSATRPSLAYIPEHLKKRLPQHRHPTPSSVEEATPEGTPATDTEDDRTPEAEPYKVDPNLSPVGVQRWHPEAFEPSVESERKVEIEYAPAQSQSHTEEGRRKGISKGGKIAIGVIVPLVVVGVAAGAAVAVSFNNWEW